MSQAATNVKVEYNFLGKSGLKVSNLCLGTMTFGTIKSEDESMLGKMIFGNPRQVDENTAHRILDKFVELGGNFIDTANVYSSGNSERIIGNWLQKQTRENIIIATKARWPSCPNEVKSPNGNGLSRHLLIKACDDSLERLKTNYIDLYQAHMWDWGTPIEETLRTFDELVRSGKIRYYGFSNVCGWQMQKIVDTCKQLNLILPVTLQQQYSLAERHSEYEEFMVCEQEGIGVLPWSPLKGGVLTGKLKRNTEPIAKDSRAGYYAKLAKDGNTRIDYWGDISNDDKFWNLIDIMEKIAKKTKKTVPQVALRWLIQRKIVCSVIIGATSVKQLEDNMGASAGWTLTDEDMSELTEASNPPADRYPYKFICTWAQIGRSNPFMK